MSAGNDIVGVLVEYIGEQTKSTPPLAFVLDTAHLQELQTGRTQFAIEHLPPRVYLCTPEELESLATVGESLLRNARAEKPRNTLFAVTVARRGAAAAIARRVEVDSSASATMLDAMRMVVQNDDARAALDLLRKRVH